MSEALDVLKTSGLAPLGACTMGSPGSSRHHVLVGSARSSIAALRRRGIAAASVKPPLPMTGKGILWWQRWRDALTRETYFEFRCQHHEEVRSRGSIIRIRKDDYPSGAEPCSALANGGVDVRCEFHCELPTGNEVHLLVPDAGKAAAVLKKAGFAPTDVDYRGPTLDKGISWWGEWKPALAYAGQVQRPILMSFASPRVEQVPGVW